MKTFLKELIWLLAHYLILFFKKIWCLVFGHDREIMGFETRAFSRCRRCGQEKWIQTYPWRH